MSSPQRHTFNFERTPSGNEIRDKISAFEQQKKKESHEKIASMCYEKINAMVNEACNSMIKSGGKKTHVVFKLADLEKLKVDDYSYKLEEVILNKQDIHSESEHSALDMQNCIASEFTRLFNYFQLILFKKDIILLYKDNNITITLGKPEGYDKETILWHKLNKIIDYDELCNPKDLLNPM